LGIILHTCYYSNELHHQTRPDLVGPDQAKSEPIIDVCFTSLDSTVE
jgi:hypothetical protein